jgi:hypothetical protein
MGLGRVAWHYLSGTWRTHAAPVRPIADHTPNEVEADADTVIWAEVGVLECER